MLLVFVDELNLWLLSLCLYAKAVRLGSSISRCLHITYAFKGFFPFQNTFLKVEWFWKHFVLFQLSSELQSFETTPV